MLVLCFCCFCFCFCFCFVLFCFCFCCFVFVFVFVCLFCVCVCFIFALFLLVYMIMCAGLLWSYVLAPTMSMHPSYCTNYILVLLLTARLHQSALVAGSREFVWVAAARSCHVLGGRSTSRRGDPGVRLAFGSSAWDSVWQSHSATGGKHENTRLVKLYTVNLVNMRVDFTPFPPYTSCYDRRVQDVLSVVCGQTVKTYTCAPWSTHFAQTQKQLKVKIA